MYIHICNSILILVIFTLLVLLLVIHSCRILFSFALIYKYLINNLISLTIRYNHFIIILNHFYRAFRVVSYRSLLELSWGLLIGCVVQAH